MLNYYETKQSADDGLPTRRQIVQHLDTESISITAGDYRNSNRWLLFFLYRNVSQTNMSHFEQVKTEYTDPELVVEAIKKAFPFIKDIEVAVDMDYEGSTVVLRGYHGDTTNKFGNNPIKIVARGDNRYDLGFALTPDGTFELVADWGGYGYGFLANQTVQDAISNDKSETERLLSEQEESLTDQELQQAMTNYPSRQQAVMGMLSRGYTMAVAEECVRVDPNLAGYAVNEIKVSVGKNEAGQLEVEHQIELVQSTIVGSYI